MALSKFLQIGGIVGGTAAAFTETDPRLYGGGAFNAVLVVSSIAIVLLGVYTALSVFGFFR